MKPKLVAVTVICFGLLGFLGWRVQVARRPPRVAHVAIVLDRSASLTAGCAAVASLARGVFALPGVGPSSTLSLMTTGEVSTAYEARLLAVYPLPFSRRIIEGRQTEARRQSDLVHVVEGRCQETRTTSTSPILRAVMSATTHLRAKGCTAAMPCFAFVVTDGEENVDPGVRRALDLGGRALRDLHGAVSNEGVRMSLCGFGQTTISPSGAPVTKRPDPRHARIRGTRLREVWTAVFTRPDQVSINPYCG